MPVYSLPSIGTLPGDLMAISLSVSSPMLDPSQLCYLAVHPGWVSTFHRSGCLVCPLRLTDLCSYVHSDLCHAQAQTDMGNSGGRKGTYPSHVSVHGMINNVLLPTTLKDSGKFLTFEGKEMEW